MTNQTNKTPEKEELKCNKNWHIYPSDPKLPCQCGKIKSFNDEMQKAINKTK